MKNVAKVVLFSFAVGVFAVSCGETAQVKDQPKAQDVQPKVQTPNVQSGDMLISSLNAQASKLTISGFPMGSSNVPNDGKMSSAKAIAGALKPIVDSIPDGHVLQITGHCCVVGSAAENNRISAARAKAVRDELVKMGIAAKKVTYKGVGTSLMISGVDPADAQQRRVSFTVVKSK